MAYTWATTSKGSNEPREPTPWGRLVITALLLAILALHR